jgi:hypothetical protein
MKYSFRVNPAYLFKAPQCANTFVAMPRTFEGIKKPMEVAAALTPSFITGILIIIRYISGFVNRQGVYKM